MARKPEDETPKEVNGIAVKTNRNVAEDKPAVYKTKKATVGGFEVTTVVGTAD